MAWTEDVAWIRKKATNPERARRRADVAPNDVDLSALGISRSVCKDQFQVSPLIGCAAHQKRAESQVLLLADRKFHENGIHLRDGR